MLTEYLRKQQHLVSIYYMTGAIDMSFEPEKDLKGLFITGQLEFEPQAI